MGGVAAGAAVVVPRRVLGGPGEKAPSETLNIACIGVGGRGNSVMRSFAAEPDCAITHICDVNESTRNQRGAEMKQLTQLMPTLVNDYRTLLDDESVDAFMVATPDHWHAPAASMACEAGKHVYVEKPQSHNLRESRLLLERLYHQCLIDKDPSAAEPAYRLVPQYSDVISRYLSNANYLY